MCIICIWSIYFCQKQTLEYSHILYSTFLTQEDRGGSEPGSPAWKTETLTTVLVPRPLLMSMIKSYIQLISNINTDDPLEYINTLYLKKGLVSYIDLCLQFLHNNNSCTLLVTYILLTPLQVVEKNAWGHGNDIQEQSSEERFVYIAKGFNNRMIPE